ALRATGLSPDVPAHGERASRRAQRAIDVGAVLTERRLELAAVQARAAEPRAFEAQRGAAPGGQSFARTRAERPGHAAREVRAQRGGAGPGREVDVVETQLGELSARGAVERACVGSEPDRAGRGGEPRLRVRVPARERYARIAGADGLATERGRRERQAHVAGGTRAFRAREP